MSTGQWPPKSRAANAISRNGIAARWWLSDEAFYRQPDAFMANFEGGLSIFAAHNIQVIPVLFNRWRDPVCDFGGLALEHIIPGLCHMAAYGFEADLFASADADPARVRPD
jgi:hypothetical protein